LWNVNINGTSGTTLIIDNTNNTLYTVSAEGYIYKIDIDTHKAQLWYNESINPVSSAIVWANNVLYVGDDQGIVWAINNENHVIWAFNASSAIVGGFAINGNTIYAGNSNGTFYALPIANTFQSLNVQSLLKNNIIMSSVLSVSNKQVLGSITYKNIYVSPNGTGDGSSIDNPIALKNVTEISSNTIVHFADGFYTLNEAQTGKIDITRQNNIVFQADNPGKAILNSPVNFYGTSIGLSSNFTIKGLVFTAPNTYYTGAMVKTNIVSNILIDSCIFENSKTAGFVSCDGEAYNITINNCTFKNLDTTKTRSTVTPCFVFGSNVSVINCNFQNISLYDRSGTLLYVKGLAVIENCTFINNSIRIYNQGTTDRGAIVKMFPYYPFPGESYLTNCVFQNNSCRYDVEFETKGYLKNNTFDKGIGIANFDYGVRLLSATNTVVLDNKTVDCVVGDTVRINATLKLLSPITNITSYQFYFLINNEKCFPSDWGVGVFYYDYKVTKADLITISAVCETVPYTLIYTGALHARLASNISLENVSSIKYGDNVTLVANLPSEVTGNVTFTINGENYTAGVKDGVSRVTINNLGAGSYNVSAKYLGDLTYSTSVSNTVSFNVSKVNSTMNINVKDINFGEIAFITVNLPVSST
ncbi:PQQ-binding-like beta-propeller repeat protein, partial [Methanobrevibacter smithii]|uniref:Ig-like domain-containing protein n=1 Tax=Methanobrevibacter smithii TaxID=2173 RepID=UPI00384E6088